MYKRFYSKKELDHTMKISADHGNHKGEFYIEKDGVRAAKMTYSKAGDTRIIIDHTEVSDSLRGTGAGKQLVEAGIQWARENNFKVIPLCPFAKSVIQRTPEYQDVL